MYNDVSLYLQALHSVTWRSVRSDSESFMTLSMMNFLSKATCAYSKYSGALLTGNGVHANVFSVKWLLVYEIDSRQSTAEMQSVSVELT